MRSWGRNVGAVMMVSQDGSGPVEGTEMGRPELASYRYKVSYGQTPDVKMGQELYHLGLELCCRTAGNTQTSNITVLSPSPSLSPPVLMMSDLRWRTTTLKPDCWWYKRRNQLKCHQEPSVWQSDNGTFSFSVAATRTTNHYTLLWRL